MAECAFGDLACQAGEAVLSPLEGIARAVVDANLDFLRAALTWWIRVPSISPDSGPIRALQDYTMPVAAAMLVASVLVQAIRMALARKKDPAINVALGLVRFSAVNAVGLTLLTGALQVGDAYSVFLLENAGREYLDRMEVVILGLSLPLMVVLSIIGAILAAIQFVLAFFRQAGILVLAAMLPIAASGSINDSTKVWMNRMLPWLVSLVLYKPMAAFIYAIGFELISADPGEEGFVIGFVGLFVILLAVVALPAMMRFFAWSQVSVTGGSGVGGSIASGASGAASIASVLAARRLQTSGPGSTGAASSAPTGSAPSGSTPAATGPAGSPAGSAPGSSGAGGGVAGGGVAGGVAAAQMAYQAGKDLAERFTSHVASGANGAPHAGGPPSARGGGTSPPSTSPPGATRTGGPSGGSPPPSAPPGGPGVAAGAAASGTPAGGGAAGAIAAARGAQQAAQDGANRMTGEEQR